MKITSLIMSPILSFIGGFIFICNISGTRYSVFKSKRKIFLITIFNILLILNAIYFQNLNKILVNLLILFFINFSIIFDGDCKKSIFYLFVFYSISMLTEIIVLLISSIFNMSIEVYSTLKFGMLIFSIINVFMLISISCLPFVRKFFRYLCDKFINTNLNIYLGFIVAYIIIVVFNCANNWGKNTEFYISIGMTVFIFISFFIVLYNLIKRNKMEDKYNQMMEYVSKYEKVINEQGKRNHEFNNQLMVLQGYIDDKKKLKEYLNTIINDQKGGQNFRIKQLSAIPDGGIKGLIYYKLAKMEDKGIKSYLYVDKGLDKILKDCSVNDYRDLTKILGVFIDNAIEASLETEKKEVEINLKLDNKTFVIEISNTFVKNKDTKKIGKAGYTSKGAGHGFGLSLVKDISHKNERIETFSDIEEDMFKQTLMYF